MVVFLSVLLIICAVGWYTRYISCMTLLYYIGNKGYEYLNDEEIKACTACVERRLWKVRW